MVNCQLDDDVIEEFDLESYNEMFKCNVCSAEFEDKKILQIHVESVHGGQTLPKCETCEAIFEDYFDLEKHVESGHDGKLCPMITTMKNWSIVNFAMMHLRTSKN